MNNAANQPKQNGNNNGKKRNQQGANGQNGQNNRNNQQGAANGKSANKNRNRRAKEQQKVEVSEEDVAKQVKETLARLTSKQKGGKGAKYRKENANSSTSVLRRNAARPRPRAKCSNSPNL